MDATNLPRTLAVIPDGNRRWAELHKLSILRGYGKGVTKFIEFSEWCMEYGINSITVWAFSTENLLRNKREVNTLFGIYKKVANDKSILKRLHKNRTRLNIIGNKSLIPQDLNAALQKIETETSAYSERQINMLIGYGGKDDILHAAKSVAMRPSEINEDTIGAGLISSRVHNIDFVIRTSGEKRLSGFLPWQTCYSELYFSDKLWPDFTKFDLHSALLEYASRDRRFGR